jgi:hypothetical protein
MLTGGEIGRRWCNQLAVLCDGSRRCHGSHSEHSFLASIARSTGISLDADAFFTAQMGWMVIAHT